jgi:hypothetical protein
MFNVIQDISMEKDLENTSLSRARGEKLELSPEINEEDVTESSISIDQIFNSHIAPRESQRKVESMVDSMYSDSKSIAVWSKSPTDGEDFILVSVNEEKEVVDYEDLVDNLPNAVLVKIQFGSENLQKSMDVYVKDNTD